MSYDLVTVGRANMDLFSLDIGAPFEKVRRFEAMVGGSPTNIAIGTTRLGLRSVAFTAVGEDRVGDFILDYLADEGVVTEWVRRVPGKLTSLALLGVRPPSDFPLSFYRDDPADIHLTVSDATALPWDEISAIHLSGNAFSRGPCVDAAMFCATEARRRKLTSFIDLDLRPTEWTDTAAFGAAMARVLPLVDVVVGTEEELWVALAPEPGEVTTGADLPLEDREALGRHVSGLLSSGGESGPETVVTKRGARGVTLRDATGGELDVAGFDVDVVNTVGAGDAFASGLIARRLRGDDWESAARYANACGAIEVTRHGCASALPSHAEVVAFLEQRVGSA